MTDIHNTASIAYQLATDYDVLYIVGGAQSALCPQELNPEQHPVHACDVSTVPCALDMMLRLEALASLADAEGSLMDSESCTAGHGILWDGYRNEDLERLVRDFFAADKTVATCSHGAVALLGVQVRSRRFQLRSVVTVRWAALRVSVLMGWEYPPATQFATCSVPCSP